MNGISIITLVSVFAIILILGFSGCAEPLNIHEAAKAGNLERVREIVENNPEAMYETDGKKKTPAVWAILEGHNDIAKYLIDKGYPLGITEKTPFPLLMACTSRYTPESDEMLQYLLENGADPNEEYKKEKWLPLEMAVNNDMPNKVKILVKYGAKIDLKNADGKSALDIANESLKEYSDPDFDLPGGELSDPKVRKRAVQKRKNMVELLEELKKKYNQ